MQIVFVPNCKIYVSKITKCICPKLQIYLSQVVKYICPKFQNIFSKNFKMYWSQIAKCNCPKLRNAFVPNCKNYLSQIAKCICQMKNWDILIKWLGFVVAAGRRSHWNQVRSWLGNPSSSDFLSVYFFLNLWILVCIWISYVCVCKRHKYLCKKHKSLYLRMSKFALKIYIFV